MSKNQEVAAFMEEFFREMAGWARSCDAGFAEVQAKRVSHGDWRADCMERYMELVSRYCDSAQCKISGNSYETVPAYDSQKIVAIEDGGEGLTVDAELKLASGSIERYRYELVRSTIGLKIIKRMISLGGGKSTCGLWQEIAI